MSSRRYPMMGRLFVLYVFVKAKIEKTSQPHPSHPSTFSFLNLYEYAPVSSRLSFQKEYGLKAARRAPQFSKR